MATTWLASLKLSISFHHTVRIECTIGLFKSFLIFNLMTVIGGGVVPPYRLLIVTTFCLVAGEGWLKSDSSSTTSVKTRTTYILLLSSD